MEEYVFCKYLGEYINLQLGIRWDNRFHPEDMNKIIDSRIRHYAMNNRLHTVYSNLYDELSPDFKKYWCVYSNLRIRLPPSFKTKKQATLRRLYNSLGEHDMMKIVKATINSYFPDEPDRHVSEFKVYFNQDYETHSSRY